MADQGYALSRRRRWLMPDSVAGLFRTRSEAEQGLRKLKEAGFPDEHISIATPRIGRRGHYGMKVAAGIAIGTLLGALAGGRATGIVPGGAPLVPRQPGLTFLVP